MSDPEEILQIVSETATVEKHDHLTGRVRISTRTEVTDELVTAALATSEVEVTRVPIDRQVDVAPPIRTDGDVTVVPVVEEILVVEKRLVFVEEIRIRRVTTTQSVEVPVSLRKQHAVIERDDVPTISQEDT